MKKKHIILLIVLVIIVFIVVAIKNTIDKMNAGLEILDNLVIEDVDLEDIEDGTYIGSYEVFPVSVETKVTIKDHRITQIEIVKHVNGKGKPAEVITDKVIEKQSLEVDTISGATHSSKVILKSIELALKNKGNN